MKKIIHLVDEWYGEIRKIRSINYKDLQKNNIHNLKDLFNYVNYNDIFDEETGFDLRYPDYIEEEIVYYNAKKHKSINWNPDFDKFSFDIIFTFPNREEFVIDALPGIGSTGVLSFIERLVESLKEVAELVKVITKLPTYFAYKRLIDATARSKEFIDDVILKSNKWECGFIINNIKNKNKIEKRVMKKLGYTLVNGVWRKKEKDLKFEDI